MRRLVLAVSLGACGGSGGDDAPPTFDDSGGTLELADCGYAVTTRLGAEAPRIAGSSVGADPTPRLVHLGFIGDPKTSIVAQWRTADETTEATTIRFAAGADLTEDQLVQEVSGIEFGYTATGTQIYRVHQAHLCGLLPGTSYSYQVGSAGHFSPVYTFRTAPDLAANPDAEVLFGVIGDSRDGYDIWAQLSDILAQRSPDLVLFTGDAVTIGLTQLEWEEFLGRGEPLLANAPIVFAHGNHEVNAVTFYSQFAMPGDQETFGFDYGHAHITVANDTPEDPTAIAGAFKTTIAADFEASKAARWKLMMHHKSMWSASNHGSNLDLQAEWMPLVDQYGIDLVLSGHDHDFEISKPLRGGVVQPTIADGTVYAVVGGAGAELYNNATLFHTSYSEKTHSATLLRVRRDLLELEAFRPNGSVITAPEAAFSKTK